jgi:uncharacterized protein YjiS (DUF1127 family)
MPLFISYIHLIYEKQLFVAGGICSYVVRHTDFKRHGRSVYMIRTTAVTIREFNLVQVLMSAVKTLGQWQTRADQRHRLNQLDGRVLADIGITRAEAKAEASKAFWWY